MFQLSLWGKSQIYTTRALAFKATAQWLYVKAMELLSRQENRNVLHSFTQAFQRENYEDCVTIWNDFARKEFFGAKLYQACIIPTAIDQPFV